MRSQLLLYITVTNRNDTISGTPGDAIAGDNSNDTISGGKGNDILTGGKGSDQFIFFSKEGTDIITDFSKGTDFADSTLIVNATSLQLSLLDLLHKFKLSY